MPAHRGPEADVKAAVGVVFRPDMGPERLPNVARSVDAAAVDELWLWEDCFQQGAVAQAAVALASSQRVAVGVGVLPAPLRSVVAAAMEIATLAQMFPGRVRVGIGHGVQSWMQQAGVAVASPLTLLREYVMTLQDLLAGREVSIAGRYVHLANVALDWVPAQPVPVFIGGAGPRTLRLAGEIADGVILDCQHTAATIREALEHVAAGRAHRDRDVSTFTTVMYLACAPGPDAKARLSAEAAKWKLDSPNDFGVGGSAEEIVAGSLPYRDAAVDTLVFQPVGDAADMDALVQALDGVERLRSAGGAGPPARQSSPDTSAGAVAHSASARPGPS
jgi:alkanesulfonate monooxygenase SsuD/methylene tetrahydromethanopterin reductase-like flavin-dependent oxidoreductase (luciferase family)